uniref:Kinesin motor domain-containing protein n=1 Tax=Denticeps clupeoides TaxID=299321 RepID=A0AAY4BB95_9TELE
MTVIRGKCSIGRVHGPEDTQCTVFEEVKPLLTSLLDGYNVCIMAYGQTGSGKTHTMIGSQADEASGTVDNSEQGIIPKAARELFRLVSEKPAEEHTVEMSVVEVYNNEVWDLLSRDKDGAAVGVKREVITTSSVGPGERAKTGCGCGGAKNRLKAMNAVRGRLTFFFLRRLINVNVHVAGMSGVTGAALWESSCINRSLSALSDVLGALAERRPHVPYRNSKLTHLLQDSIGGDAKLLVMLCVSPTQHFLTESLQSLGLGTRARQVQREPPRRKNGGLKMK